MSTLAPAVETADPSQAFMSSATGLAAVLTIVQWLLIFKNHLIKQKNADPFY